MYADTIAKYNVVDIYHVDQEIHWPQNGSLWHAVYEQDMVRGVGIYRYHLKSVLQV